MDLPIRLIKFWFVDAYGFFIRIWRNLLAIVEEDLALKLMVKLLFVPLFHDSTIVGRVMSFLFRFSRIMAGLVVFAVITFLVLIVALAFWAWPVLWLFPELRWLGLLLPIIGLISFLIHYIGSPAKTVSEVSDPFLLFEASRIKAQKIDWKALCQSKEVKDLGWRLEIDSDEFVSWESRFQEIMLPKVLDLAKANQAKYLTEMYFWYAMLSEQVEVESRLLKYNLKLADIEAAIAFKEKLRQRFSAVWIWDQEFGVRHLKGVNRGWILAPTPILDSISTDLTYQAANFGVDKFVGREEQLKQIIDSFSSGQDKNILVVGPAGAGKTTLARYLAQLIVTGDAPEALATKRIVQLDLTKLLANVRNQGDVATRISGAFKEVKELENIIIFVDEIQNFGVGEIANQYNLYGLIEPYLTAGTYQFLATTDKSGYEKALSHNSAFVRIFRRVDIPAATQAETSQFLADQAISLEKKHQAQFSWLAIRAITLLSDKLIHDRVLPDSAISVLRRCLDQLKQQQHWQVTTSTVKTVLGSEVQAPLIEISAQSKEKLLHLEEQLHQGLIDQVEAVKAVSDTLRRAAVELNDKKRPIGSFLFVGPTGVGKTELAKQLAKVYFANQGNFFRLDMSEYQTQASIDRLIGSGSMAGILTEEIARKPYTLLLLDEFEKADPKILTLFLQVLEDGQLTDYMGKTVSFRDTIIIATSNAASLTIAQGLSNDQTVEQLKPMVQQELLGMFKPELLNRFDNVVIFKPLSIEDLQQVVKIKLAEVRKTLADGGYLVEFSPELVQLIGQQGYDPVMGARPLRRLIQDKLESHLSRMILEGKLAKGELFTVGPDILNESSIK